MSSNNEIAEYKEVLLPLVLPTGDYCLKIRVKMCACQYFSGSGVFGYCPIFQAYPMETSEGFLKLDRCKVLKEKEQLKNE